MAISDKVGAALGDVVGGAMNSIDSGIAEGKARMHEYVQTRLRGMFTIVEKSTGQGMERFKGVDEESILTFIPDDRTFSGVTSVILGMFFLYLLPSSLKWLGMIPVVWGLLLFGISYIWNCKTNVPEGFEGVICRYGLPIPGEAGKSKRGRNWIFSWPKNIPFLVSKRDQVVTADNATFTADFASIGLQWVITFRVADAGKFISNTSPAGVMKILEMYASYISLRIITSITDARVKFTGRERLDNVVRALNNYLSNYFGIEVIRVTMPSTNNSVLEDLETVQTTLAAIEALEQRRRVTLENAVKTVEQGFRTLLAEVRSVALELQQKQIALETGVATKLNSEKQGLLVGAQRRLEVASSEVHRENAALKAKINKALQIKASFESLKTSLEVKWVAIKRKVFMRFSPRRIVVFGVKGMGPGLGMSVGPMMFQEFTKAMGVSPEKPGHDGMKTAAPVADRPLQHDAPKPDPSKQGGGQKPKKHGQEES